MRRVGATATDRDAAGSVERSGASATDRQAVTGMVRQSRGAGGRRSEDGTVAVWWRYADHDRRGQARELLRSAAAEAVGAHPAEVRVGRAASGAPELSGAASGLLVGVSHTRGLVTVAVAGPGTGALGVGVDVEAVRPLDALALAGRWFTADEAAWVRALPPALRSAGLLDLWTRKEAAGKSLGTGLRGGGLRRPVGVPPPGTPPASPRPLTPLPGTDRLAGSVLPGPRGYVLACAVNGAGTPFPALVIRSATPGPGPGPEPASGEEGPRPTDHPNSPPHRGESEPHAPAHC
ncbi:4'-phosphopantetheinyl transferase family protein [Streptomyces sp. NPDC057623]|uniref:4'-phosphopantetheinyl transferase family protein n=1 Tax=Streptomyces sp. NPDC057623 TaxID=3346187 RepID=UPI0036CD3162